MWELAEKKELVCVPSHAAEDELLSGLAPHGPRQALCPLWAPVFSSGSREGILPPARTLPPKGMWELK